MLGINEPPVTIKNIENAIVDRGWDEGWVVPRAAEACAPARRSPSSAPARPDSRAAAQLNRAGHTVTVLERADRPGGLLMYGIPNMKLDKREVVAAAHQADGAAKASGSSATPTSARTSRRSSCCKDFDAIVLCTGATQPRDLPVEGRDLQGVHFAMEYLTASTKALLNGGPDHTPDPRDAARTSS